MAASSSLARARWESVWDAWVVNGSSVVVVLVVVVGGVDTEVEGPEGKSMRTNISFMWGCAEVAIARSVGSVGQIAMLEGEKAIQALEWGARFCLLKTERLTGGVGDDADCCWESYGGSM